MNPLPATGTPHWDQVAAVKKFVAPSDKRVWFYVAKDEADQWIFVQIENPALKVQFKGSGIQWWRDGRLETTVCTSDASWVPDVVNAVKYKLTASKEYRLQELPAQLSDLSQRE